MTTTLPEPADVTAVALDMMTAVPLDVPEELDLRQWWNAIGRHLGDEATDVDYDWLVETGADVAGTPQIQVAFLNDWEEFSEAYWSLLLDHIDKARAAGILTDVGLLSGDHRDGAVQAAAVAAWNMLVEVFAAA